MREVLLCKRGYLRSSFLGVKTKTATAPAGAAFGVPTGAPLREEGTRRFWSQALDVLDPQEVLGDCASIST